MVEAQKKQKNLLILLAIVVVAAVGFTLWSRRGKSPSSNDQTIVTPRKIYEDVDLNILNSDAFRKLGKVSGYPVEAGAERNKNLFSSPKKE
ncbi:MAG: hypothetical protein V1698_01755 [bacterium]